MHPSVGSYVTTKKITMEFVDSDNGCTPVQTELQYDPGDPYAVGLTFLPGGATRTQWVFSRDLLIEGCYEPAGTGDVVVWPCLSANGAATVIIELSSPDGEAVVQAPTREVADFVRKMLKAVPLGSESAAIDVAASLEVLLSR